MKILGIKKIYFDTKKLRCTLETNSDINYTVEVDLESTDKTNRRILEELEVFSGKLLAIIEKDSL